jgi:hypothetical protein
LDTGVYTASSLGMHRSVIVGMHGCVEKPVFFLHVYSSIIGIYGDVYVACIIGLYRGVYVASIICVVAGVYIVCIIFLDNGLCVATIAYIEA